MKVYKDGKIEIAYETLGLENGPTIIWGHGWGQSHVAFMALASSMERMGRHILVDFPGFGQSRAPVETWGTDEYSDAMARFIQNEVKGPVLWVGHSFGCRVGLRLAAKYPDLIDGLFLIAAAGIPRKRPPLKKLYMKARISLFKFMKKFVSMGLSERWLYKIFGSSDYRHAGAMRGVFVKVVNEDVTPILYKISCPVMLAYGTNDTETPLEMGERFHQLMRTSDLMRFEGLDHYTILTEGRHQVASALKRFMERVSK